MLHLHISVLVLTSELEDGHVLKSFSLFYNFRFGFFIIIIGQKMYEYFSDHVSRLSIIKRM